MIFEFKKMTQDNALIIANQWKYEGIYAFYDMTADIEDYNEFVNEELRNKNDVYEALVNKELVGFFCLSRKGTTLDIGLGLKPNMCGKGLGKDFLTQILNFIEQHYTYEKLTMSVATFNKRAIKVYQACGFKDNGIVKQYSNDGIYEFLNLIKP